MDNQLSQDATPQEWEKSVKRYVMEELWGFDPIQEEAGLSERLRNELKNFVEAINHFTATLRSELSAAQEENKKLNNRGLEAVMELEAANKWLDDINVPTYKENGEKYYLPERLIVWYEALKPLINRKK